MWLLWDLKATLPLRPHFTTAYLNPEAFFASFHAFSRSCRLLNPPVERSFKKKKAFWEDSPNIISDPACVLAEIGITGQTESRMWAAQLWPPSAQLPLQSPWVGLPSGHSNSHISTVQQSCLKLCAAMPSQAGCSVSQGAEVRDPRCREGFVAVGLLPPPRY